VVVKIPAGLPIGSVMPHRPTVLLVHDDIAARLRLGNWLSSGGYRCLTADDTASALRFAGRTSPDVAVIDIGRRDKDRLWLAERLRERATPIGVVLMSGDPTGARAADASRIGAGLLIAPSDPGELLAAVERAASWRHEEEVRTLDVREILMATVAARHLRFKAIIASAADANTAMAGVAGMFPHREPALLGHARRVGSAAARLAAALHLSPRAQADIRAAGLLHDLGKLSLPETVLLGNAPLGDLEMEALIEHRERTLDLLGGHAAFAGAASVLAHVFERWDGRGYPDGLSGRAIPFGARIVAAADLLDVVRTGQMVAARAADPASVRMALEREAGARLDPDLVRVLLHLVEDPSCS
jgi:response regulator RpfG family c-di-GMP phosphodiesterase